MAALNSLRLVNNRFLPDDMAAFIGGYGTDSNGWTVAKEFDVLSLSPQTPSHPDGDTLYFFVSNPYIAGLPYSGTADYIAEYEFDPKKHRLDGDSSLIPIASTRPS